MFNKVELLSKMEKI